MFLRTVLHICWFFPCSFSRVSVVVVIETRRRVINFYPSRFFVFSCSPALLRLKPCSLRAKFFSGQFFSESTLYFSSCNHHCQTMRQLRQRGTFFESLCYGVFRSFFVESFRFVPCRFSTD